MNLFVRFVYLSTFSQGATLWRTRTKLEKYLIIAVGVLSIAFVVFLLCARSSEDSLAQYSHGTSELILATGRHNSG